jgi:hypothetical protein
MTVPIQQYKPVGTHAVEMAVATTITSGSVVTVRVYLRSQASVATPSEFITDNSLEHEVVSRAGLDEDTTFASYELVSSSQSGSVYEYVVDATVSS